VKKRQENLDPSTADLTREEEQHFEFSPFKVASRVADVHNNMGAVHEMNRQYEKARSSYMDALEVYHNTWKRFEEKGYPDVDRTKKNVERMTLACNSEQQRKALHDKATGIARRLEKEIHSEGRKNLFRGRCNVEKRIGLGVRDDWIDASSCCRYSDTDRKVSL
jgi:hypothetical protein